MDKHPIFTLVRDEGGVRPVVRTVMGVLAVKIRKPSSVVSARGVRGGLSTASIVTALIL
jgi:hypothetical protein